jgi:flagellin-like protein
MDLGNPTRRAGISELMATILLVAVTLIAGAALFGYVEGQASVAESNSGAQAAANINAANEKFSIQVLIICGGSGPPPTTCVNKNTVTLYVYNSGTVDLTIASILIRSSTGNSFAVQVTDKASCGPNTPNSPPNPVIPCYVDTNNPTCDSNVPSEGFTATGVQPESYISNVPLPFYTFSIQSSCSGSLGVGTSYTVTLTGIYSNQVSQASVAV